MNSKLPTGAYPMLPLSAFTCTFHDHKKLPDMWFTHWAEKHDIRFKGLWDKKIVVVSASKPTDVNIILHPEDVKRGWTIQWEY